MKNRLIANELRISYHKRQELSIKEFRSVTDSKLMNGVFRLIWDIDEMDVRESFYALYFNNKLDLVGYRKIADGGIDAVHVDIRLIMSSALLCNATKICVAHNHPSGALRPSQADRQLTRKMIEAGKILDIQLLDHLILTGESYYSLRNEGDI